MRRGMLLAAAGCVGLLAWGEWLNRRWSTTLVARTAVGREAVVVLGFRNRQARANFVNRARVRAALRSVTPDGETLLIFSGGAVESPLSEARVMAAYAVEACGYGGQYLLEEESRTTWENVACVVPVLEGFDRIKIVSQPAHALQARLFLRRQRPDLAARLVRAADYRFGELLLLKPALAAHGLLALRGVKTDLRGATR